MASSLLITLVTLAAALSVASTKKPWFCQRYDCPAFTSVDHGAYEVRSYEESQWVATSITSKSRNPSGSSMFRKLFNYIKDNKIDMTVPVLTKTEKRSKDYKITMMFYIPNSSPPTPTQSGVFLVTRPASDVYVRSFPGYFYPRRRKYERELKSMKNAIPDGESVNDKVHYRANYNSPYEYFKKKQFEVWMDSL